MPTATSEHSPVPAASHVPLLLEVKGNALDDGPGIRSVVFLKGCPLSCTWCHNPESRRRTAELAFDPAQCVAGCTRCIELCPRGALDRAHPQFVVREACDGCFACVEACPSGALSRVGRPTSVNEVMDLVRRDKPFFAASGGGVTFSGGEPMLYPHFLGELAAACRSEGIHTLLETAGQFRWDDFETAVLPHLDTVYFDLKLMDARLHQQFCGVSNEQILANFVRLAEVAAAGRVELEARVPLVPGITATSENVLAVGDFLLSLGIRHVRLLDYNPTWVDKPAKLGSPSDLTDRAELCTWLPRGAAQALRAELSARGVEAS